MDLAYAGTARFGSLVLDHLLASAEFNALHRVVVCVTTPDRPRGRHGTPQPPPLKETALAAGLPVLQPERLDEAFAADLGARGVSVFVVCAYGRIVPTTVLAAIETLVVHPSLLPRWRGAAPVQRALMAGETELGVATLRMVPGVDEGPIGDLRLVHVPREADAGAAFEALAQPAAEGLLAVLDRLAGGRVEWREQEGEPTYAAKIDDADRLIDWRRSAREIADRVRALSPQTGAVTELGGRRVLVWRARPVDEPPTTAHGDGPVATGGDRLVVAAGEGWLEIFELQEEGRRRITAQEYLRGARSRGRLRGAAASGTRARPSRPRPRGETGARRTRPSRPFPRFRAGLRHPQAAQQPRRRPRGVHRRAAAVAQRRRRSHGAAPRRLPAPLPRPRAGARGGQ